MAKSALTLQGILKSLILLFTFFNDVTAQELRPGFIVDLIGETHAGFINSPLEINTVKTCTFRKTEGGRKIIYKPGMIRAFGIGDNLYYESVTVSGLEQKAVFARMLVKGSIGLLKYTNRFFIETDTIVELQNPVSKVRPDFREKINALIADCKMEATAISFNEISLINIIRNYNLCKGAVKTFIAEAPKNTVLRFSGFRAMDYSLITLAGYSSYSLKKSVSVPGGIALDLFRPIRSDKIFISFELWTVSKVYNGYGQQDLQGVITRNHLVLSTAFIKLPAGIGYSFKGLGNSPYVKGGIVGYIWNNDPHVIIRSEVQTGNVIITNKSIVGLNNKVPFGLWLATGYYYRIQDSFGVFVEFRAEENTGVAFSSGGNSSATFNFNIMAGVKF